MALKLQCKCGSRDVRSKKDTRVCRKCGYEGKYKEFEKEG